MGADRNRNVARSPSVGGIHFIQPSSYARVHSYTAFASYTDSNQHLYHGMGMFIGCHGMSLRRRGTKHNALGSYMVMHMAWQASWDLIMTRTVARF